MILIFYELLKWFNELLILLCEVLGDICDVVVCCELIKWFEEVICGILVEVVDVYVGCIVKGEIVVLVGCVGVIEVVE